MDAVATLRQAVQSLYSWDPAQQAQANSWLNEFQATEGAWKAAGAVFQESEPHEVQFFAASLLLRKARTEWGQTDLAARVELRQMFR